MDGSRDSYADLLKAIQSGDHASALAILEGDPALCTAQGEPSALLAALYRRQTDVAATIAERRGTLTTFEAAASGDLPRLVSASAADPAWPNRLAPDGFTALHLACFFNHPPLVEWILANGAHPDVEAKNPSRVRPLHSAAAAGSAAICTLLIDAGADPQAEQEGGFTALHSACLHGNGALVELLIAAGADASHRARDGRDAFAFAREGGHDSLAERLSSLS